ncbi:hypothetical protein PISL3812_03933 [Talaromyces islandicus]|uniref:STEEP1 domain-containing protein n=1 Tax=Talaromyces islandicus TaxID=28573 RepID=A0A0U1LWH2_TALIS|nr:hypothetical protein PISL3812_03933 [Talaromyces islandicus]
MSLPTEHPPPTDHEHDQSQPQEQRQQQQQTDKKKKEIKTFHCRYCSHLLLASTRDILSATAPLARRGGAARDRALILDIQGPARQRGSAQSELDGEEEEEQSAGRGRTVETTTSTIRPETGRKADTEAETEEAHYTIPLATLLPDPKPIIIRRDDGFEKRVLFKCGRCRVVVGYEIVPQRTAAAESEKKDGSGKVMYLMPGSLVATEDLHVQQQQQQQGEVEDGNPVVKQMDAEWRGWVTV